MKLSRIASLIALFALARPANLFAQFALGAGGQIVNDTRTPSRLNSFDFAEFHAFFEGQLDKGAFLQLRYAHFGLPGSVTDAPNIQVNSGVLLVTYQFREPWWRLGFFGGGGVFHLSPNEPRGTQSVVNGSENVVGWQGGLMSAFDLTPHIDFRVEASISFIQSAVRHAPIFIGAGLAYHF